MNGILGRFSLSLILCIFFSQYSTASVPGSINYQGQLLNAAGEPIITGVTITFTLWDAAADGTQLGRGWSDSDFIIPETTGVYNTDIGDHPGNLIAPDVFLGPEVWLQVAIEEDILLPRTRMLNVPYAFHAEHSDTASYAQTATSAQTAAALSGSSLNNPGDTIQLGDQVQLAVTDEGQIEFQVNNVSYRLVEKKWFWDRPQYLNEHIDPAGASAYYPLVESDDSGNILVAWIQSDGLSRQVFKSEFRNGTWNHPTGLSENISPDGQDVFIPQGMGSTVTFKSSDIYSVAMDNNGNAIIVWNQYDGTNFRIYKSEYRDSSWTIPDLTEGISPNGQDAYTPQVAMSDSGTAMISWSQSTGSESQIFLSTFSGGQWNHPATLNDHLSLAGSSASGPKIVMNDHGDALITWAQSDGSNSQIFKTEYQYGTPFSFWDYPDTLLDNISPDGQDASHPQVSMDNNGNFIIAWEQSDGNANHIYKSEYRSGTWTHPSSLSDRVSSSESINVHVAMSDNGSAVMTWSQGLFNDIVIVQKHYMDGSWDGISSYPQSVSFAGVDSVAPHVAINDNGSAIITWFVLADTGSVYKSEYREETWLRPSGVHEAVSLPGTTLFPHSTIDNDGNGTIVWVQGSGTETHIFKSDYRFGFAK